MRMKGFTLLEVLVAMSIFAIIGLSATRMLQTIIESHERTGESTRALVRMTQGMNRLQTDVAQMVPRPVRDEYGEPLPALTVANGRYLVEFTRTGWSNPLGRPRSELQRVAYDVVDGKLVRYFWLVLDRAEDSEPIAQTIFQEVEDFRVYLIDKEGDRTDVWPALDVEHSLPEALEMIISLKGAGELRRLIALPSAPVLEGQGPGGVDGGDQPEDELSVERVEDEQGDGA